MVSDTVTHASSAAMKGRRLSGVINTDVERRQPQMGSYRDMQPKLDLQERQAPPEEPSTEEKMAT
jgi:hypothetical protein